MERFLKSKYKIGEKIGEDAFTVTYKGTFLGQENQVVIKIYKRSALNGELIKIMRQKVKNLTQIRHNSISPLIDGDYGWQGFYYVRGYLPHKTLREFMDQNKPLTIAQAVKLINNIGEALAFAHKNGFIHGALSPHNVFVADSAHQVILTDFVIEGEIKNSSPQKAGLISHKAEYLSPEEIKGAPASFSSDIYSLGLLFYEMLSGENPFKQNSSLDGALKKLTSAPPKIREKNQNVPPLVENIIEGSLAQDPLLRFKNIEALLKSLNSNAPQETSAAIDLPIINYEDAESAKAKASLEEKKQAAVEEHESMFKSWTIRLAVFFIAAGILYTLLFMFLRF